MEPAHRIAIANKSHYLTKNLDIDSSFLQYLLSEGVITPSQQEQIDMIPSSTEKAIQFKQLIVKRGRKAFPALIAALIETNQKHIADVLSTEEVSKWINKNPGNPKGYSTAGSSGFMDDEGHQDIQVNLRTVSKQNWSEVTTKTEKYYTMTSENRGRAIIVSNNFEDTEEGARLGNKFDENNLKNLYLALKFNIDVWQDKKAEEIKSNIEELLEDPKLDGDAFIFTVLSHGDQTGIRTKDGSLKLEEDIIKKFSMCKVLQGKPKVFIIQACRGHKESTVEADAAEVQPHPVLAKAPSLDTMDDCFVMYSTVEGYKSYRDITIGSWFVRDFIYSFIQNCHEDDFETLMTKAIRRMDSRKYEEKGEIINQIGSKTSNLRKKLHFLPNSEWK